MFPMIILPISHAHHGYITHPSWPPWGYYLSLMLTMVILLVMATMAILPIRHGHHGDITHLSCYIICHGHHGDITHPSCSPWLCYPFFVVTTLTFSALVHSWLRKDNELLLILPEGKVPIFWKVLISTCCLLLKKAVKRRPQHSKPS